METPPTQPRSPWNPLRRLSRWPLIGLQVLLGMVSTCMLFVSFSIIQESREWRADVPAVLAVTAGLATLFGLIFYKTYRFERELAKRQADPTCDALAERVLKIWMNQVQQNQSLEQRWISARPRLRLAAIAGMSFCLFTAVAFYGAGVDEYLHRYYDRRWSGCAAVGGIALFGAGVFLELYRCASKLSPDSLELEAAMEHYRRFHNYGCIFALGPAWAMLQSILI